jgi:hypothetical protein
VEIPDGDLHELEEPRVEESRDAGVDAVVEQLHSLDEQQDAVEDGRADLDFQDVVDQAEDLRSGQATLSFDFVPRRSQNEAVWVDCSGPSFIGVVSLYFNYEQSIKNARRTEFG